MKLYEYDDVLLRLGIGTGAIIFGVLCFYAAGAQFFITTYQLAKEAIRGEA